MLEIAQSDSPYNRSFQVLLEEINSYERVGLISLLDQAISAWQSNSMLPSQLFSIMTLIDKRVDQITQPYRNAKPVLVCSFSPIITMGALLSKVFLKVRLFDVRLINITYPTDLDLLIKTTASSAPSAVIFSFSLFHFIEMVSARINDLLSLETAYYAGGVAFDLKPEMKNLLPGVAFPLDLSSLVDLLEIKVNA
ncbi:hypothetical protein [Dehalogenimonas sp. 4OHTPN]|uniref:B12-binding domain-containing protein n=1 Tax=Dehalogenimonas sp. 4OHTPN TaxID=3166643 RepID=A0AAU8GBJ9_9CHLR